MIRMSLEARLQGLQPSLGDELRDGRSESDHDY